MKRTRARVKFDLDQQMELALQWLLTPGNAWGGRDYITASDLEQRVRGAAVEIADGMKYGEVGLYFGSHGIRIQGLNGMSLLHHCRTFLFNQMHRGRLEAHNFGRGHCSGMRFRKAGSGPNKAEVETMQAHVKQQARGTICHYKTKDMKRSFCISFNQTSMSTRLTRRGGPWTTDDREKVTCKRCLVKLAKADKVS